jgi:hypothetical protein
MTHCCLKVRSKAAPSPRTCTHAPTHPLELARSLSLSLVLSLSLSHSFRRHSFYTKTRPALHCTREEKEVSVAKIVQWFRFQICDHNESSLETRLYLVVEDCFLRSCETWSNGMRNHVSVRERDAHFIFIFGVKSVLFYVSEMCWKK